LKGRPKGEGFDIYVDKITDIEKQLGIYGAIHAEISSMLFADHAIRQTKTLQIQVGGKSSEKP
jgi:hypothetical protein